MTRKKLIREYNCVDHMALINSYKGPSLNFYVSLFANSMKVKPCAVEGICPNLGHLLLIGTFPEPTTRLIKQKGMHENYIADQNQKVLFGLATIASY